MPQAQERRSNTPPREVGPRPRTRVSTRASLFASLLIAAGALGACKKAGSRRPAIGGVGRPIAAVSAADLRLTPDRKVATYLSEGEKPRLEGIPPQMLLGSLNAVALEGGVPRKLGHGVTNLPGGYLFSPDSKWILFLSGYNAADRSGELNVEDLSHPDSKARKLGSRVTYMLVSPDSKWLTFVDGGVLKVGALPEGPFKDLANDVSTADFSPDSRTLIFKRKILAGGSLLATALGEWSIQKLGEQVGEYLVSPDSKRVAFARQSDTVRGGYDLFVADSVADKPRVARISIGAGLFAFSPDGKWLARTEGWNVEHKRGDLWVGPATGGPGRMVGEKVGDRISFSPDSTSIAYLELWDEPSRTGLMGVVALPDGKPLRVGGRVPNFGWGANGRYLAFLSRFVKPAYSVDLMLYRVGDESSRKINPGVFGYGFGPRNEYLVFRANCIRDGRACDLFEVDPGKPEKSPRKILDGIYSFKMPEAGDRMLVTYARTQSDSYDVASYNFKTGERKTLDEFIRLPAMFASEEGSKAVYIVARPDRPGVYVAEPLP